jgi:hypothetical protein
VIITAIATEIILGTAIAMIATVAAIEMDGSIVNAVGTDVIVMGIVATLIAAIGIVIDVANSSDETTKARARTSTGLCRGRITNLGPF